MTNGVFILQLAPAAPLTRTVTRARLEIFTRVIVMSGMSAFVLSTSVAWPNSATPDTDAQTVPPYLPQTRLTKTHTCLKLRLTPKLPLHILDRVPNPP